MILAFSGHCRAAAPENVAKPNNRIPGLTPPFQWSAAAPVIEAKSTPMRDIVALKDPTIVRYQNRWHLFATTASSQGKWGMTYLNFADWKEAGSANQFPLDDNPNLRGYHCAPQVFFFRPQNKWYLIYQSPQPQFSTTTDLADPMSWSKPANFFPSKPSTVVNKWLDYWIICDETHAYLFFSDDDGRFYRSRTKLESFPNGFEAPAIALQEAKADCFEASCTYRIKGTSKYLMFVEAMGKSHARYFRAFLSDSLDGQWRPLATTWEKPFAGASNVRFADGKPWTDSISHGELLRDGYDETMTIDPSNLVLLYQGTRPAAKGGESIEYSQIPWSLGLLHAATPIPGK